MKRRLAAFILLCLGLPHALGVDQRSPQDTTERRQKVRALFAAWDAPGSPGGAVVPTHVGEVVLTCTYGFADIEHGVPISPATRFELASALGGHRTRLRSRI